MKLSFAVFLFIALFSFERVATAQSDQGTITGVIQNPSGAVIVGANLTLRSADTGRS